ncbi:MAG: hypothetical protein ACI920_003865 [Saprospiraceae bacterium]|jgi:uncharacterized protein (DUF2235 family)
MTTKKKKKGKNIIICLDGTGNQHGKKKSNVLSLFRMLERGESNKQVAYYDPGVGTMGDPTYKTAIGRKVNKLMGLAFGRGLMKNLIEAYTFLIDHYEDGDEVFIFGFSRGAYTARALAAFVKECGLLEKGAKNLLPYAVGIFLKKAPKEDEEKGEFFRLLNGFRSTFGRLLNIEGDARYPGQKPSPNKQLRIRFMGLFDTVKSYGWISNPVVLRNEKTNTSVLNLRHAISIDEKRKFFHQMHWKASSKDQCKEVWFAGDHSDVGGGHSESKSGLAKIALEWMVHEAIQFGMKVDIKKYSLALQRELDYQNNWTTLYVKEEDKGKYSGPNPIAPANDESLKIAWKLVQLLPKKLEPWEDYKGMRTIKSEEGRQISQNNSNVVPVLVHQSVLERIENKNVEYEPKNLSVGERINKNNHEVEQTISKEKIFTPIELEILRKKRPVEEKIDRCEEIIKKIIAKKESLTEEVKVSFLHELKEMKLEEVKDLLTEEVKNSPLNQLKELKTEEEEESFFEQLKELKLNQLKELPLRKQEKNLLLEKLKELPLHKKLKELPLHKLEVLKLKEKKESLTEKLKELKFIQLKGLLFEQLITSLKKSIKKQYSKIESLEKKRACLLKELE